MHTKTCYTWSATPPPRRGRSPLGAFLATAALCWAFVPGSASAAVNCTDNTITANVVVLDSPTVFNRLGAQNPNWITYALERDVVDKATQVPCSQTACTAGNVELRPDKRPRPLVVRGIAQKCLTVNLTNLLAPIANPNNAQQANLFNDDQVAGRCAGFHATGTELVGSMADDGSMVGDNPGAELAGCGVGMAAPGDTRTYNLYTPHEGAFVVNSYGATLGGDANGGNLGVGMFGVLNVEPVGSRIYRSQVTEEEMRLATVGTVPSDCAPGDVPGVDCNTGGQPIIDYEATYPNVEPWISEGKANLPVLNMLTAGNELVHSDINAIIAGPDADGSWNSVCPGENCPYPLESVGKSNPSLPNRLEPFREFTSVFHDEQTNSQVYPQWYNNPVLGHTLAGVRDSFMINYGSGGIGSEIISNRLHTGPMHDCTDCAYEEFFLASQTVGDPGLLVQFPANTGIEQCDPAAIAGPTCWRDPVNLANGPIPGNFALYQEDPSNVHHSYTGDFAKIRNTHVGAFEQHVFHLHNHQWLFNPNDDNANYLDAQEIMPGSGHTYELAFGGVGNRNKTVGDAIFHCHFYPHFAQGMWYHIRVQDTFEKGSVLAVSGGTPQAPGFHATPFGLRSGQPMAGTRALPDGELPDGVPIPATVPMPGKAMPQMPARVEIVAVDRGSHSLLGGRTGPDGVPDSSQAVVDIAQAKGPDGIAGTLDDVSPGYPFWLAGNSCGEGGNAATGACPEGIVGQRMPTPPLDMLSEQGALMNAGNPNPGAVDWSNLGGGQDGGLPRHALLGYVSGGLSQDTQNRLAFSKVIKMAKPVYYPEIGTALERVGMAYQSVRNRPSAANLLGGGTQPGDFVLNGSPPVPGGPFQDPCVDDRGQLLARGHIGEWFDGDGDPTTFDTKGASAFDAENPRTYKVANVQIDAVFNKVGYHYPQERIIVLWDDVAPTIRKERPPEPLVMRFNTFDCGKLLHANLVPEEFELDDFQVRTPTDIIGQHIHLPKWDLTTNDGAANGWNYEDGTLSPIMVEERIHAINDFNLFAGSIVPIGTLPGQLAPIDLTDQLAVPTINTGDPGGTPAGQTQLHAVDHPDFGPGIHGQHWTGARTTIQRILNDPIVNVAGVDRGLGLTFSHDHYGPSTFQQIGLYSTILAEPAGSEWRHNETGELLGARHDGGPTSWQAAILPPATAPMGSTVQSEAIEDHREFYFEMSDFQHAYEAGVYVGADEFGAPLKTAVIQPNPFDATVASAPAIQDAWLQAVNPTLKLTAGGGDPALAFPDVVNAHAGCPGPLGQNDPNVPRPCAEAINIGHGSMWVVNYRNEPVGLRVFDPNRVGPDGRSGTQAAGAPGDLALAFESRRDRAIAQLNTPLGDMPYPTPGYCDKKGEGDGINCDRRRGDPITPIMRSYENDHVKIKIQVGATEEQHQASIHGLKWLSNGSGFGTSPNSGWRNFQSHGISEQFSLQTPIYADRLNRGNNVDHLYLTDATRDGVWSGTWGILRNYTNPRNDLYELPENPTRSIDIINDNDFTGVCPKVAPVVEFDVTAVLANDVLPNHLGVTIPDNANPTDNEGGPLNPAGGTLVYNRRGTIVPDVTVQGDAGPVTITGGAGPLHDPTAMLYVPTADLISLVEQNAPAACFDAGIFDPVGTGCGIDLTGCLGPDGDFDPNLATCPVVLRDGAPVEPIVLRASAGDCIEVTLRNRLPAEAPDLAGWQDTFWVVNRDLFKPVAQRNPLQMSFFGNNLVRPSSAVGLHPQLVEYDATRDDGVVVGQNNNGTVAQAEAGDVSTVSYRWYAGHIDQEVVAVTNTDRFVLRTGTPVEFGGSNLLSADRVKQPQKGLFGALVIEPEGAVVTENTQVPDGQGVGTATRLTRAQVDVSSPPGYAGSGGDYRETTLVSHKTANLRWVDGTAIKNVKQAEFGVEGAEDMGHAGFNYGMEPSWFRFKLPPDAPSGNAGTPNSYGAIPNPQAMYANALVLGEPNVIPAIAGVSAAGDPQTPVFRTTANPANPRFDSRMYVLNGASADRDGTFILHGHVWQRDPHVCLADSQDPNVALEGRCDPNAPVASQALGLNLQAKYMGGEEGLGHAYTHWPILFDAGGSNAVTGDYLLRDYAPSGNRNGQFGILRVQ